MACCRRSLSSVWAGIQAMQRPYGNPPARWKVKVGALGWWCHAWTPRWHEGRGPYVSIGLGIVAIYRGY